MKKCLLIFLALGFFITVNAQTVTTKLVKAYQVFENNPQLSNAISSLYVIDATSGNVVFEKNASMGLVPASTQKIITSATAYELLSKNFRYKTEVGFSRNQASGILYIKASGDPTFGSWRWPSTKEDIIIKKILDGINEQAIQKVDELVIDISNWESQNIPDGWILQDIGNYYGAGSEPLNWRENQFDIFLKSGAKTDDPVQITGTKPELYGYQLESQLKSAAKGSGDNAYIYFPFGSGPGIVRGTIPMGENRFVISGAFPSSGIQFAETLNKELMKNGKANHSSIVFINNQSENKSYYKNLGSLYTHYSPPVDSIIYWLNKKSINLYAEALLKTISLQKNGMASREQSIQLLKKFWSQKGIPEAELNIVDGSGLSPLNRTTTKAQVAILQYAWKQPWFEGFFNSLPEYNGMKMKSGTIGGVKGFTGYHKSRDGKMYLFSFLVNNYNGQASALVQKMYQVLNELK